jgi:Ran GTPase-activating protein (RanGAP) involved in mRNA processing and transport
MSIHITNKSIKLSSTSEWSNIIRYIRNMDKSDENNYRNIAEPMLKQFVEQIQKDEISLKNNDIESISDAAIHAPRSLTEINKPPFRVAYYCAKLMYQDTGRITNELHSKIHWQRLISKLTRVYIDNLEKQIAIKAEFKINRLLEHQRKNWCELKKRTIQRAIGKPEAMPVDIAPSEELQPFFEFLNLNTQLNTSYQQFKRGTFFSDGRMDLCKQVVGPTWIGELMKSLKNNTQIRHFLLGNNITGLEGGKAIYSFLTSEHMPHIETWYLAGQDYSDDAIKYITTALENDKDIESLWLKRNPIYAEGGIYFRNLLEKNSNIKILDLHNTALGLHKEAYKNQSGFYEQYLTNDGMRELCEGLKINTSLRHLYLDANALSIDAAKSLADVFTFKTNYKHKGITSLWINMNRLYDEGIDILVKSLENYPIKRLIMGSNMISDIGMKSICNAFKHHKTLKMLDLSLYKSTGDMGAVTNNIGDNGAVYIAELLQNNTSLRYLNISMNNISADAMKIIVDALETNTTLWYLIFTQYDIEMPQTITSRIYSILERNRALHNNIVFNDKFLRYLRCSKKIDKIDSIYRNNM